MPPTIIPADAVPRGSPVVGWARVTGRAQKRDGALDGQKWSLIMGIRERGLVLRAIIARCESGKLNAPRPEFLYTVARARYHGAGIVAPSLARLIRAEAYDPVTNWTAVPTHEELEALCALAEGVPFLATILPPDLPAEEVHSARVREGQRAAENSGGRPSTIPSNTGFAILRDVDSGHSYPVIADRYGVSLSAVKRFVSQWKKRAIPNQPFGADRGE